MIDQSRGFTLVELIVMMVVMGVLAAYVGAKLNFSSHDAEGYAQTMKASIRLAQKLAIARRTAVTVTLTPHVAVGSETYPKPGGVAVSGAPASITFDGLGRPDIATVTAITVSGGDVSRLICVEPQTGYVHEEHATCS